MERAAVRARQVAAQTGTRVVVMRDGVIVHEAPDEASTGPPAPR